MSPVPPRSSLLDHQNNFLAKADLEFLQLLEMGEIGHGGIFF